MKLPAALLACLVSASSAAATARPNIIHILIDDFGWNEVGYHNPAANEDIEVVTPNIDGLVKEGLELDRMYVHKICSPSRTSIQSGRNPVHCNVQNVHPEVTNEEDSVGGWQGLPLNMSTVADVLKAASYDTHFVGKWDVGMATPQHVPYNRGYDTFLGYFHHSNDYWQQTEQKCYLKAVKDLWLKNETHDGPATWLANDPACSQSKQEVDGARCVYEEEILLDAVLQHIDDHAARLDAAPAETNPMFLFYSTHLTHMPLQVPQSYLDKFAAIDDKYRRSMRAMSYYLDLEIGAVVARLKETGIWDNTVLVLHSDNGGEIMIQSCGSNNHPLRGGKFSNFEGGIRVNGLVSGGALPEARRGEKSTSFVAGEDWLATYAAIAGVSEQWASDGRAVESGLPDFDSVNQWPMISSGAAGRSEVVIGDTSSIEFNGDGDTLVGGVISEEGWKLLLGAENKKFKICQDVTTVVNYPDGGVKERIPEIICRECGREPVTGCLFNVFDDPTESDNKALTNSDVFATLLARVDELQQGVYSPDRGKKDKRACKAVRDEYGGYWGPFVK
jgi:arylsulfatase I/J